MVDPQAKYGVLLVSGGRTHQENYAPGFAADPRCRLIGLTDEAGVPPERTQWNAELATKLGIPILNDIDAALRRPDVHIVSVCCEPERRARVGAMAARAGKHVYMDKPLGGRLDQVRDLATAVAQHRVKSQMFSLLRTGAAQRAKRVVDSGRLGSLAAIHCDLLFAKGRLGDPPPAERRKETYPPDRFTFVDAKREVFTTAIYSLVLIAWLTGKRFTSVRATTGNYFFKEHKTNDVEDFGALLLTLEGDTVASVTAGRIGWTSHRAAGPNQTVLVGTKGTATIDGYRPRLEIAEAGPPWAPPPRNPDDPMGFWASTQAAVGTKPKREWQVLGESNAAADQRYFIDCVERGRESDLPVATAAHVTEVVFAAYKSAAKRQTVHLPLDE